MEDRIRVLKQKLDRLLKEAAEVSVELDRTDGTISGVPHCSVIEARAQQFRQQLSRQLQQRQMAETGARQIAKAACPTCGTRCQLIPKRRKVTSIAGPQEFQELEGSCPFSGARRRPLRRPPPRQPPANPPRPPLHKTT